MAHWAWSTCIYKHPFEKEEILVILGIPGDHNKAWKNDNLQVNDVKPKRQCIRILYFETVKRWRRILLPNCIF